MRPIDADKLTPIIAPIAGIVTGELTHYEKIVLWQTIKDAPTVPIIDLVLEIIDRARNNCRKGFTRHDEKLYLSAIEGYAAAVRQDILALKGGEQE